ncbi:hypothetical protein CH063_08110 [Colletotrichum higginsianum]|uniref:Uncharacterized protein n=1 Tax=Colletotrichum higginsianum (strain IMI 349063) TaxID=759273 RepID=H1V8L6_COLHI|nr:hypothetical protein CH063_08110 [Colletotrichum higginsianum]
MLNTECHDHAILLRPVQNRSTLLEHASEREDLPEPFGICLVRILMLQGMIWKPLLLNPPKDVSTAVFITQSASLAASYLAYTRKVTMRFVSATDSDRSLAEVDVAMTLGMRCGHFSMWAGRWRVYQQVEIVCGWIVRGCSMRDNSAEAGRKRPERPKSQYLSVRQSITHEPLFAEPLPENATLIGYIQFLVSQGTRVK